MAGEWIVTDFADAIDFQEGPGILAKDFHDCGVPLIRLSGLDRGASLLAGCNYLDPDLVAKKWAHFALQKGDILLSTSASLGRIAVVADEGVGAIAYTGIIRMRPQDERMIAPFIRYLLEGPNFQQQAESFGAGSVIRHFGPTHLRQMNVLLPPPAEQRVIAHILGTLDDKIELNRRRNETLEAMARALFKDWFVDFGPVRAKMEGREPYLPADLWELFPERLDDEDKPEKWETANLDTFASLVTTSVSPGKSPETMFEHYSIPAFDAGRMPAMELGESIKSNKYMVHSDAVLVSKLNPQTPRVWLPAVKTERAVCSTEFMQFTPRDRKSRPYLYGLMSSQAMQDEVLKHVTGSTGSRQRAQPSQIAKVDVLIPSSKVLSMFNRQVEPILDAIAENRHEAQALAQLRDTLLPKLISGEVRIKNADKFIEEHAL